MLESMLNYLAELPDVFKILWLALCLSIATIAELLIPLKRSDYNRFQHLRVNLFFLASTIVVNALFSLLLVRVLPVLAEHQFGVSHWIDVSLWLEFVVALLLLDLLAQYGVHYLLHKVPFLWRFHQVHHSDVHVTASTGTRHHPLDYCAREVFTLAVVAFLGAPIGVYIFYRLLTVVCTYFTHSNIALPPRLDWLLSWVIVTPNAHKFHHHYKMPWTDRNFGNIFSVWDRCFGTYVYQSTDNIRYGVDTMDDTKADSVWYQLSEPFRGIKSTADNASRL